MWRRALIPALAVVLVGGAQDPGKPPARIDPALQARIDEAIRKGTAYLKAIARVEMGRGQIGSPQTGYQLDELVLWTLLHAVGDAGSDPLFQKMLDAMLARKLESTYCVSLQAMILEELDSARYRERIKACAQFLVDNQCANGQWSYGVPTDAAASGDDKEKEDTETKGGGGGTRPQEKPKARKRVPVTQRRQGPAIGDNSNAQYAALGLRACHDAGIQFEKKVIDLARKWWRGAQYEDSSLDDVEFAVEAPAQKGGRSTQVARVTVKAKPLGWCYGGRDHDHKPYGSMTAGAVGAQIICDYLLGEDWRKDKDVHEGLAWLTRKFSVTCNPGPYEHVKGAKDSGHAYYYFLYALERAGLLYGTEILGKHEWYREGAEELLRVQGKDGSWGPDAGLGADVSTCFAILFLRRATRPLAPDVETGK